MAILYADLARRRKVLKRDLMPRHIAATPDEPGLDASLLGWVVGRPVPRPAGGGREWHRTSDVGDEYT